MEYKNLKKLTKEILVEDFSKLKLRQLIEKAFDIPGHIITTEILSNKHIVGAWEWDLENDRLLTLHISHLPVITVPSSATNARELGLRLVYSFYIAPREPGLPMKVQEVVAIYRSDFVDNPHMILAHKYNLDYCYTRLEPNPELVRHDLEIPHVLDPDFNILFNPSPYRPEEDVENAQVMLAGLSLVSEMLGITLEDLKDLAELNHLGFLSYNNQVLLNVDQARILTRFLCREQPQQPQ
jgi:hypothetical protein